MAHARILHVVEACLGGVARHVFDLARGCLAAGCEVHVLYAPGRMSALFEQEMGRSPGVVRVPVPMSRSMGPGNLRAAAAVRRYIRRAGPFDVVHGHSSVGGAVARLAGLGRRARVVYTPNAIVTMSPYVGAAKRRAYGAVERLMAPMTDAIICVSPEEERHIRGLGVAARRLAMIPNSVGAFALLPRPEARARLGLPAEGVVVGYVGRLVEQKDPEMLVRAFGLLRRAGRDAGATLAMIGDGPLEGAVVRRAADLGLSDAVRIARSDDARGLFSAFDVLAMPSRYEGMPYVALEAMVAGLPVVATAASSVELPVRDGLNGFVVPGTEPDPFAEALGRVLSDPDLRARMGAAARARAGELFSVERMVASTLEVYGLGPARPA